MTLDALDIYRRTLTSAEESDSAWWYLGTSTAEAESHPEIIVSHVETVMIYRARTLSDTSYRVPWWEIGVFRDAITGELPESWINPVTGASAEAALKFEEGPSGFSLRDNGPACTGAEPHENSGDGTSTTSPLRPLRQRC